MKVTTERELGISEVGRRLSLATVQVIFPSYGILLQRDQRYVAFNPQTFVAVEINPSARLLLEALREPRMIGEFIEELRGLTGLPPERMAATAELLQKWLNDGLLESHPQERPGLEWRFNPDVGEGPQAVYISLTSACNQSCSYCFNAVSRQSQIENQIELTLEEWKRVLRELKALGFGQINFTGGEPLLSPNLKPLVEEAKRLGLQTKLLTNATLIDEDWARWMVDYVDMLNISLDGSDPAVHDVLRGSGTFEQVTEAIRCLVRLGHKAVVVRPVVSRYNVHHLTRLADFIHNDLGCKIGPPTIYVPNNLTEANAPDTLLPRFEDYFQTILEFTDYSATLVGRTPWEHPDLKYACRCGTGSTMLSLDSQGDVYPCQAFHSPQMLAGNVGRQSLAEIYQRSLVLKQLRELPLNTIEHCKDCPLVTVCGTGCRAIAHNLYGHLDAYNELFCPLYREASYERIWRWIDSSAQFSVISM